MPPVTILIGDEPFFKEESIREIDRRLGRPTRVNVTIGRSQEAMERVLREIRTATLFSDKKLVCGLEAEDFLKEHWEAVIDHHDRGGSVTLVLELRSLDGRTKAGKTLKDKVPILECKKLYETTPPWRTSRPFETPLAEWTCQRGIAAGLRINLETAHALTQITGNDLYEIAATIDKLRLSGVTDVRMADVEALAGRNRRDDIFQVTDAIGRRDWAHAIESLNRIFARGMRGKDEVITDKPTIGILAAGRIWSKLKEILRVRAHLQKGGSKATIAKACAIPPFLVDRAVVEAEAWMGIDLVPILDQVYEAESALKGLENRGGAKLVLERLIIQMSREKKQEE